MKTITTTKDTSSDIVKTGECLFYGILLGCDGANNPTITVYDGTDNTGAEILPSNEYDALALGLNGVLLPTPRKCFTGIYVEITCAGTVEVVTLWQTRENAQSG